MRSNENLKTEYEVQPDGDSFVVLKRSTIITSPNGKEIRSRFPALLTEVKKDLITYGINPSAEGSFYGMESAYIDFGQTSGKDNLILNIISDMKHDKAFNISADPESLYLVGCYRNSFFQEWNISPSCHLSNYNKLCDLVKPELSKLTLRQIMAIVIFVTMYESSTLGLALITDSIRLDFLAQGLCDLLEVYNSGDIINWDIAANPNDYCRKNCCIYGTSEYPIELDSGCPIIQILEKLKIFAQFPDE